MPFRSTNFITLHGLVYKDKKIVNFVHDIEFSDDIKPKLEIKEEPIDVKSRFEEIVNPPYLVNGNFATHSYETDTLMILQIKSQVQMHLNFITYSKQMQYYVRMCSIFLKKGFDILQFPLMN